MSNPNEIIFFNSHTQNHSGDMFKFHYSRLHIPSNKRTEDFVWIRNVKDGHDLIAHWNKQQKESYQYTFLSIGV